MAAVTYIAVFFATLVYALRLDSHFPAVAWLGASLLMPVAGFRLTLLTTLVLTKVAKVPSDFKGMLASSGLGMTFPATLAAGSIVLLLVYPGLISLLGVASFAVWAVVTVGTLLQVYGVKLNLVTILLCVAFCIAGYYVVSGLATGSCTPAIPTTSTTFCPVSAICSADPKGPSGPAGLLIRASLKNALLRRRIFIRFDIPSSSSLLQRYCNLGRILHSFFM